MPIVILAPLASWPRGRPAAALVDGTTVATSADEARAHSWSVSL